MMVKGCPGERMTNLTGQCLCGDIKFEIRGEVDHTSACHCGQCRQWAGHYWPSATVNQNDLVLTKGEQSIAWYESSDIAERGFCIICGSSLFWRRLDNPSNYVSVAMGCLDQPTGLTEQEHIHTDNKGDYYRLPSQ
jgi:hypothetical protein